ncbi:hypothetical protein [Sphingobium sp. SYK-6]|nr:hypothetical protein [Sphingobium sp. SYK-6]
MIDWILSGFGAWLGNRWFGAWFKRHPIVGNLFFIVGTIAAIIVLLAIE